MEDAKVVWQEEAREEGLNKGRIEIARKMKAYGRPIEEIVKYTGISPEDIGNLESMTPR